MTMGNASISSSIEDPSQPEWLKHKSLREIEVIRETKKNEIVNRMLSETINGNVKKLYVAPGQISLLTVPVQNSNSQNEVFSVRILDPDQQFFENDDELKLISDQAELSSYVVKGSVERPPAWNLITN